jgi:phosphatidylglycerol:prolipoprotein diacylglycerol transferase
VITAIPVFLLYTRRYGLPPWKVLDVLAPGVALGIGIGRFGCLLNGCCWGLPTKVAWAVQFPAQSIPWQEHVHLGLITPDAATSLPVHPTQVYLALAGWLLLLLTLIYFPHRRRHGEVMALLMVGYSLSRFAIEFLRADEPLWPDGLTISQNISIAIFVGGLLMWAWLRRAPAGNLALPATAQTG